MKKYLIVAYIALVSPTVFANTPPTLPSQASTPLPTLAKTQNIDTVLTGKVQLAITKVASLKGQGVSAASHNGGVVTLEGSVADKAQEKAAIKAAYSVKGVKKVKSQLTIKLMD